MSDAVLLWIAGGQLAMIAGLARLWWSHIQDCRARVAEAAVLRADLDRVIRDIGDHERGIRGSIHELRNTVSPFVLWAQMEMEKRNK